MCQQKRECEDHPFMLPEQKRLSEYFSLCETAGKVFCFSVRLLSVSLKRAALVLHEPGDTRVRS